LQVKPTGQSSEQSTTATTATTATEPTAAVAGAESAATKAKAKATTATILTATKATAKAKKGKAATHSNELEHSPTTEKAQEGTTKKGRLRKAKPTTDTNLREPAATTATKGGKRVRGMSKGGFLCCLFYIVLFLTEYVKACT
jgi:hypothetical protein